MSKNTGWFAIQFDDFAAQISQQSGRDQATSTIRANTTINMDQDASMAVMDGIQRQYALDINTLTINQQNIEDGQNDIKQMIRDLP